MKNRHCLEILLLHGFLLGVAAETLVHYPDVILWVGAVCLTVLLIRLVSLVRKGASPLPLGICHAVGTGIQFLCLNRLPVPNLGLGGGLAHFFYQVMLAAFLIFIFVGLVMARCLMNKPE